ncbi:MAG: Fur family transcriptional regulator [Polyangiales bacterium]
MVDRAPSEKNGREEFRDLLHGVGLRVTGPRVAVLRKLRKAPAPVSHPELNEALAAEGFDRATIYRNLTDLTEAGLVRRADLGDHVWRFELVERGTKKHDAAGHPHFVCDNCGVVQCLPDETVRLSAPKAAPRAVRQQSVAIQLRGTCDRCD